MQESLWNMNAESAHSLVESVMRDRSVLLVKVWGRATRIHHLQAPQRPVGNLYRAGRDILVRGERIGHVIVEMDDARSQQELREKQMSYIFVLGAQLAVSMALIVLFLNRRLLKPLRRLTRFSDRLSHGDFDTPLASHSNDELGRLTAQLEQMRAAIGQLFEDVGQREERFRTIVTQVPGAVFRYRPDGPIDFVSDAIEDISGYSARQFMRGTTHAWADLICPEDRREHRRAVGQAVLDERPYALEYRIVDAFGIERWVAENGQPQVGEQGVIWIDGIIADISQRKHQRDAHRSAADVAERHPRQRDVRLMFVRHRPHHFRQPPLRGLLATAMPK